MSTPTAVANAELARILRDNEESILALTKSNAVDLSEKMFQSFLISDSMMDQFSSLDHSRVEPQLQLRYLLRLVTQRIQQDERVGVKLMSLLEIWGEHELCKFLKKHNSKKEQQEAVSEDDTLNPEDVSWILEALVEASPKWETLATALGLHIYQRRNIKGDDNIVKLQNVLDVWLSGGSTKTPTVNTLIQALQSKIVDQGRLAQEVEKQFKAMRTAQVDCYTQLPNVSDSPLTIVLQSPRKVVVEDGKSTLFLVRASHRESVSYQWTKNGQPLLADECSYVMDWPSYSGVHSDILIINYAHQGTKGEYTCLIRCQEREVLSNKVTLFVLHLPQKEKLLDLYSINTQVPLDYAWPPVGVKIFINLVLIKSNRLTTDTDSYSISASPDQLLDKTQTIEYGKVFGSYKNAALILVEGRPGSGKTTLVSKLIKDWAEGCALVPAKLVFLISLRMLLNDRSEQDSLLDLLEHFYNNDADLKDVVSDLERNNGDGVCFVFDGLDEYHPQLKDKSVVFRLLHKSYLPRAMIIVSSRSGAMERLRQEAVTQHIEVFGFTKDQISEYIDKFPFDTSCDSSCGPAKLKDYLRLHPNVFDMCYLPIHAAIICFVYQTRKGHLPHTQTRIYEEFTRSMIVRHLKRSNINMQLFSLQELPNDIYSYFSKLCLLAFNMTMEHKQVIDANDINFTLGKYTSFRGDWTLGLVTYNHTARLSGVSTSYMFLHLTLQEYLAAYYIANQQGKEKRQLISKLKLMPNSKHESMLKFCFGLEKFKSQIELECYHNVFIFFTYLNIIHCAFESQKEVVCEEVLRLHNYKIVVKYALSADVPAMAYFISKISRSLRILSLEFIPGSDINNLLHQIHHVRFPNLKELIIHNSITRSLQYLSEILGSCQQLTNISVCLRGLALEEGAYLAEKLKHLKNVEKLLLAQPIVLSSDFLRVSAGLLPIINQIHCLTQVNMLYLTYWKMDLQCCKTLASNICHLVHVNRVFLSHNDIDSAGAICLSSALKHCTELKELNLKNNCIGSDGAISLASALHCFTELEELDLSDNNIGSEGAISLASELHHLTKLVHLFLSGNGIDVQSAIQVIFALKDCRQLKIATLNEYSHLDSESEHSGFQLVGIVAYEDYATVNCLVAAAESHTGNLKLQF